MYFVNHKPPHQRERYFRPIGPLLLALIFLTACISTPEANNRPSHDPVTIMADENIDLLAERYVKLALVFGRIDKDYVDAYTGPTEWQSAAEQSKMTLEDQYAEASSILAGLFLVTPKRGEEARLALLQKNVTAMIGRMRLARGEKLRFDEEAAIIYDAIPPRYTLEAFDKALADLDQAVSGTGELGTRLEAMRKRLYVPKDKIPIVMKAAIEECRARTKAHYNLPTDERFDLEFVKDKPWSAYNYYQGNNHSLIQVNQDMPFMITRALDLGCHEGYPGHHVWNLYVENEFIKKNGWLEFQLFPLFSPSGLFAEGSANYAIDLAFPGEERLAFELTTLYPLAGLNPEDGRAYDKISQADSTLSYVSIYVARHYLDGDIDKEQAISLLMKYHAASRARAEQSLRFYETYRAYIINYSLGKDLVRRYIEQRADDNQSAWDIFETLLKNPTTASDLR